MDTETLDPVIIQNGTRKQRRYSDADKVKALTALDLNSGNLLKTSKQLDIPIMTLSSWRNGIVSKDVTETRNKQRPALADLCEDAAYEFLEQARQTVESSKGTQAATGAAIFIDKTRLLREQPVDALSAANAILSLAQLCKIPDSDRDAFFASAAESFAVLKGVEVGLIVAAAREIEAKQLQAASVDIEADVVDNDE
jgi:hypothetical protein